MRRSERDMDRTMAIGDMVRIGFGEMSSSPKDDMGDPLMGESLITIG